MLHAKSPTAQVALQYTTALLLLVNHAPYLTCRMEGWWNRDERLQIRSWVLDGGKKRVAKVVGRSATVRRRSSGKFGWCRGGGRQQARQMCSLIPKPSVLEPDWYDLPFVALTTPLGAGDHSSHMLVLWCQTVVGAWLRKTSHTCPLVSQDPFHSLTPSIRTGNNWGPHL